jgi:hypothetical protein
VIKPDYDFSGLPDDLTNAQRHRYERLIKAAWWTGFLSVLLLLAAAIVLPIAAAQLLTR